LSKQLKTLERTVVIASPPLTGSKVSALSYIYRVYGEILVEAVDYMWRNNITSWTKAKKKLYAIFRARYPDIPSHYVHEAIRDASQRIKSFRKLKKKGLARTEKPVVMKWSVGCDNQLWKLTLSGVGIATRGGWVSIPLRFHKLFWRYYNSGWRLAGEAKVKLDKGSRQLIVYLVFFKDVEGYKPRGFIPVDVNENNVTVLIDGSPYLLKTRTRGIVLGYYYRRKRIQEKYDKLYGVKSRTKRKILKKLREKHKKEDTRWKIANIVVREAYRRHYAIVLENLGDTPAEDMIEEIRDDQLRHRVFQASFKGIQEAIVEKAREHGVPVIYVNPRNTSRTCPIHKSRITYSNGSRMGKCSKGGELWHRDVVAVWNLLLRARRTRLGDGSTAPSLGGCCVDGSPVPLGSTATHEPIGIPKSLWARRNPLDATMNLHEMIRMNI